jgi:hypothetical protein
MTVLVDEIYGIGMIRSNRTAREEIEKTARRAEGRAASKTKGTVYSSRDDAKLALALRMAQRRHPLTSKD